jgi:hypothetical protein
MTHLLVKKAIISSPKKLRDLESYHLIAEEAPRAGRNIKFETNHSESLYLSRTTRERARRKPASKFTLHRLEDAKGDIFGITLRDY